MLLFNKCRQDTVSNHQVPAIGIAAGPGADHFQFLFQDLLDTIAVIIRDRIIQSVNPNQIDRCYYRCGAGTEYFGDSMIQKSQGEFFNGYWPFFHLNAFILCDTKQGIAASVHSTWSYPSSLASLVGRKAAP